MLGEEAKKASRSFDYSSAREILGRDDDCLPRPPWNHWNDENDEND